MKKGLLVIGCFLLSAVCFAQDITVRPLSQRNLGRMKVRQAGSYSGIAQINDTTYALVNDDDPIEGFSLLTLHINSETGKIRSCSLSPKHGNSTVKRDMEAVTYFPQKNTLFIADESTQEILEYDMAGHPTGRKLNVPENLGVNNIQKNRGFESLCYDKQNNLFWTVTEAPLRSDVAFHPRMLRIQSFGDDLQPRSSFNYLLDQTVVTKKDSIYVHGISGMMALEDGRLIVMEREALITPRVYGSYCTVKLFLVKPEKGDELGVKKTLLHQFTTNANIEKWIIGKSFANYEGICAGPKLKDGRQTILLVNDSQKRHGKKHLHLKDYLKVMVIEEVKEDKR